MCQRHHRQWCDAGRPDLPGWQAAGTPLPPSACPPPACRISYCSLWAQLASVFCHGHDSRWKYQGRPGLDEFAASCENPGPGTEHIDLRRLPAGLRLEIQYVLQCRGDEQKAKLRPMKVRPLITLLAAAGMSSLLEQPEEWWTALDPGKVRGWRQFILDARRRVEALAFGAGWDAEYPRDTWRLRNLGIEHHEATVSFAAIPQPWLKDLAKRHIRWQLATGLSASTAGYGTRAVTRFAAWLSSLPEPPAGLAGVTRPLLESYLAVLQAELGGRDCHGRYVSELAGFLKAIRRHGWDDARCQPPRRSTPRTTPTRGRAASPRPRRAHVMAQVEQPANLARQDQPGLPAHHPNPHPLRAADHLSRRAALRLHGHRRRRRPLPALLQHQDETRGPRPHRRRAPRADRRAEAAGAAALPRRRAGAVPPAERATSTGARPVPGHTYRSALYRWLEDCDIRDEHGQPVHLTPHQWRHTLGTVLINRDVPQHVVQKILDHDSPLMTAHYARLSDKTVREHWEKSPQGQRPGPARPDQPRRAARRRRLGEAAAVPRHPGAAQRLLPAARSSKPARMRTVA